jgi:FkbM family methyltransferase
MSPRRLIFRSFQSPGDGVMLTATVRDLHLAHKGKFETDVRTSADALWLNNPYITRLSEGQPGIEYMEMHYPLIHECNQRPYHFIHGFTQYLEQQLSLKIPVTRFAGDIHLSAEEKNSPPPGSELGIHGPFWIMMAGGKYDFTAKWWNPAAYQRVVDHFQGKIQFVQCGEQGHWHPPLEGVINLVGKTDTRAFIRLVHHADGVVCPVTFAMHLAAAVETRPGKPRHRPCVVIAGGREPPHWEAYPHHQFLSTVGALPCCADGGCWKSRCQPVGDGDSKDRHDLCTDPVQIKPDLRIPRCMELITPEQVIERIELYYRGGSLKFTANGHSTLPPFERGGQEAHSTDEAQRDEQTHPSANAHGSPADPAPNSPSTLRPIDPSDSRAPMNILINFRHGLGDAVQLTIVLKHLRKYRPDWNVDIAALVGKHSAYRGLCRKVYVLNRESLPCCQYQQRFALDWHECHTSYSDSPSTKVERCLREEFKISPDPDLCTYSIQVSGEARNLARSYLEKICAGKSEFRTPNSAVRYPVVLIHYEGNTSADMKNIPTDIVRRLCDDIIEDGFVPVILDWDYRTPLADGVRIHCPDQRSELWHGTGTGDAESLAALIELSTLVVGVDSGPLHVAGATTTPTLGVWTRHHPLHYCAPGDNVTHLVSRSHADLIRGDRAVGEAFFETHYQSLLYDDLEIGLRAAVRSRLTAAPSGLVFTRGYWVRSDMAEQDLVVVQDVAEQDAYRIDDISMSGPVVVDVGAHIGCFSKRFHQRNPLARIIAVECCPENIHALKRNVGEMALVVQGAVTYEPDVALLNAVYKDCVSTGGSIIVPRDELNSRVAAVSPALRNGGRGQGEPAPASPRASGLPPAAEGPTTQSEAESTDIRTRLGEYWPDFRPVKTLTLEDLMRDHALDRIDILKLDCEGSEYSILGKSPSLERIGLIVGEYHGREKFDRLVSERFAGWNLQILKEGEFGTFWLHNPSFDPVSRQSVPDEPRGRNVSADSNGHSRHFHYKASHVPATNSTRRPSQPAHNGAADDVTAAQRLLAGLRTRSYGSDYYLEHKAAGLDYLEYGQWQTDYTRWLVESLGWKGKRVLDVGCACGTLVRGFCEAGTDASGIDVNEHMIQLGRQTWPDLASRLAICDAVNLHLFDDGVCDGLHSAQIAEHWRPMLVPHILAEFCRVTRPGGLYFCILDTAESFARQGRTSGPDDPTHLCIQPMSWWHAQLSQAGWLVCTSERDHALRAQRDSFLYRHDWDWFVARRAE